MHEGWVRGSNQPKQTQLQLICDQNVHLQISGVVVVVVVVVTYTDINSTIITNVEHTVQWY